MVDSEPLWFAVQRDFVRARGSEWTPLLASRCVGGGLPNALRVMERELGFAIDLPADMAHLAATFVARVGDLALKPGCLELIEAAGSRGLPRAVASSSTRALVDAVLSRFGLDETFQAVVTGECVARAKPWPDIFLEASARLGTAPADCVVLEDSLAGVRAARSAGMTVIAVPEQDPESFEQIADAVVGDLHAARALLGI